MDQVKDGVIILFGEARYLGSSGMNPGAHFRQDNDFYYFTCVEDLNSIEGMVFVIEPALYYPEKGFGIRIEDTVLITREGCEVLTKRVLKEIEDIEKLMTGRK